MNIGVVILAAGASSRMGQPKLLLPWNGTTVLAHLVDQWTALGASQLAVVMAADDRDLAAELDRLGFPQDNRIENFEPKRGMFSSVQAAAAWPGWDESLTHWILSLGDQPHVARDTHRQLLGFAAANPGRICQPSHHGRRRHPVVMPQNIFCELPFSKAGTLKEFIRSHEVDRADVPVDDAGLDLDLDHRADYEAALERFEQP